MSKGRTGHHFLRLASRDRPELIGNRRGERNQSNDRPTDSIRLFGLVYLVEFLRRGCRHSIRRPIVTSARLRFPAEGKQTGRPEGRISFGDPLYRFVARTLSPFETPGKREAAQIMEMECAGSEKEGAHETSAVPTDVTEDSPFRRWPDGEPIRWNQLVRDPVFPRLLRALFPASSGAPKKDR